LCNQQIPLGKLLDTLFCIGSGHHKFATASGGVRDRGRQVFAGFSKPTFAACQLALFFPLENCFSPA
jgi:hypothetical protein